MVGFDPGFQITQRYLNTAAYAGDPTPGAVVSTSQVSGSIIQNYGGFVGRISPMAQDAAAYLSDPAAYPLYRGDYQYVQFDPLAVQTPAIQGQVVFWKNLPAGLNLTSLGFIVSPDITGANLPNLGCIAGIALANTVAGNYWFIQVSGVAQVKFGATQGAVTPAVGDLVFADYSTPGNLAYDPVQSTTNTALSALKAVLGIAWKTAPAASTISPVLLGGLQNPKHVVGGGGGEG